ncbi:sulfotransferase [Roseicyclus mahoneyensis]|uniref:Sulfotransferase family protein n=1 Tax=Roseicyclus mahoneyensis TaxID=164332 RepID=A0A316GJH6_9RHOB|nr:sulfotransferase [Roseicyclus mahoneyensis]PWK61062.1 sulfotransferase family protein [Roseicyclus mahoneyensis]
MSRTGETLFYCIGAQKAGTTWLSKYLGQHPEVFVPHHKEMDYFFSLQAGNKRQQIRRRLQILLKDCVTQGSNGALREDFPLDRIAELSNLIAVLGGKADYLSLFHARAPGVKAFGDLSPSYSLLAREAYTDMAGRHPDTRFIFLMRDPVMRFWSSVRMWYASNAETRATKSIQELFYDRLRVPTDHLVLFSRYGRVINELESVVPRERIHYDFYEHIFSPHGQSHLDKLTDFLGVSRREGALDRKVWETDTTHASQSDLTQTMRDDAREVFDQVYKVVRARFGDAAPASWLWETDTKATVASAGGSRS